MPRAQQDFKAGDIYNSGHFPPVPADFPAPTSCTTFDPKPMGEMFNEGYREASCGQVWRRTPTGVEPGEDPLMRSTTNLNYQYRGPGLVMKKDKPVNPLIAPGAYPAVVTPQSMTKGP